MNKTIGIIGGGLFGKRIAQEAKKLSVNTLVLDPSARHDETDLVRFAEQSDVLTYEFSLPAIAFVDRLEGKGAPLLPSAETRNMIQDQFLQSETLKKFGIPVPDFVEINSTESLANSISEFRFPLILKRKIDPAEGKGDIFLRTMDDLSALLNTHVLDADLKEKKYMLEKQFPFIKEISVMVARNMSGETIALLTDDGDPANNGLEHARRIAAMAVESLNGVGVFGVEMFTGLEGTDFVKGIDYCPHHANINLHVRSLLDFPLRESNPITMEMNIL